MLHLIIQYYTENQANCKRELDYCLRRNLADPRTAMVLHTERCDRGSQAPGKSFLVNWKWLFMLSEIGGEHLILIGWWVRRRGASCHIWGDV